MAGPQSISPPTEIQTPAQVQEALRRIPVFADLSSEELDWFVEHSELLHADAGVAYVREGEPAEHMVVILEGEIVARREQGGGGDQPLYTAGPGTVTGLLPYSRMTLYPRTARAVVPSTVLLFHKKFYGELFTRTPVLLERLIHVMLDRVRDLAIADQQHEKLLSLGKLSAGLAHELNNPASAVQRATTSLSESLRTLVDANVRLDEKELTPLQRRYLACAERETIQTLDSRPELDAISRAEREEQIATWLMTKGVDHPWALAPLLVDMNWSDDDLDDLASRFDPADLSCVFARLTATTNVGHLGREIRNATQRISNLIETMRGYSQMDRMSEREVDVHEGLEQTVAMFGQRISNGLAVSRDYDRALPPLMANAGALNQVWTNLIDNALDAMGSKGELSLRTKRRDDAAVVEVQDSGPGIPPEIGSRIFEPFFSTKPQGKGVGLGLDTVFRIVRQHHGNITFESKPGATCFAVRLPFRRAYAM
jgi:signal transduction histidine kinase